MKKTTFTLLLLFTLLSRSIYAQNHTYDWTQPTGGASTDEGMSVFTDKYGNVYQTGSFYGTVDFDPGTGVVNLISGNGTSGIFVTKKDDLGNLLWARKLGGGGGGNDLGTSVSVDTAGNVYTVGYFNSTGDFDPGASTYNLTSSGGKDIFISKLDSSGNFVWAKAIGSRGTEESKAVISDMSGNVYLTGTFYNTVDFNPGAGVYNLTSAGGSDCFIAKLNNAGDFVWAKSFASTGNIDEASGICLDRFQNVYTTGSFDGIADFDPGAGVYKLTVVSIDTYISKLDSAGNFVWAKVIGGNTGFDRGVSIQTDSMGNVYNTGSFSYTADFDPGPGTYNLSGVSTFMGDIYVLKLDGSGNFIWAKAMGGSSYDEVVSLAVETQGAVYITGSFESSVDFNPGAGISTLTSNGLKDIFITKLDSSGLFKWAYQLGGTGDDRSYGISLDPWNNLYTTGAFSNTVDFDPGTGITNYTSAGQMDIFLHKITSLIPVVGGSVNAVTPVCSGNSSTLTLTAYAGKVARWESAVAPFTTWTPIAHTTATYTTATLNQTTKFRAIVQSGPRNSAISDTAAVIVNAAGTWLGTTSSDWSNPSNWCGGVVPTATTDVVIGAGTLNNPLINTTAVVNAITVNTGATLGFTGTGNSLDIRDAATFTGTFTSTGGTVIFGGSAAQTIPTLTYDNLNVNGGSDKSLAGNTTVNGTLTLTSGTITLGSNDLTLASGASLSGGSSSSFIITNSTGSLVQSNIGAAGNTGSVLYPVGISSTSYTPASIINAGTADTYSIRVFDQVYPDGTTGTAYTNDAVSKTWMVNEGTVGGSDVTLTLQWNSADELPGFDRTLAKLCQYTGTLGAPWTWGPITAASGSDPYTLSLTSVTTLNGPFAVGYNSTPLPVKFTFFTANYNGKVSLLNWQTASEINNSHFDIERSVDGKTFEKIGQEQGAGNSNVLLDYAFTDVTAQQAFTNTNVLYYRLKQVDFNGKSSYSAIKTVVNTTKNVFTILSVQPNPFNDKFELNYTSSSVSSVSLEITDMVGKTIHTATLSAEKGVNTFNMPDNLDMKGGVYFVRLTQDNETKTVKIVKYKTN